MMKSYGVMCYFAKDQSLCPSCHCPPQGITLNPTPQTEPKNPIPHKPNKYLKTLRTKREQIQTSVLSVLHYMSILLLFSVYPGCPLTTDFQCGDLSCIANHSVCDGVADCGDHTDEMNCPDVTCRTGEMIIGHVSVKLRSHYCPISSNPLALLMTEW